MARPVQQAVRRWIDPSHPCQFLELVFPTKKALPLIFFTTRPGDFGQFTHRIVVARALLVVVVPTAHADGVVLLALERWESEKDRMRDREKERERSR